MCLEFYNKNTCFTQLLWIENPKVVKRTESPKSSRQAVILSEAKNLAL